MRRAERAAYRDDLRRLALLVMWLAPRDILAAHLRWVADRIEVKEQT